MGAAGVSMKKTELVKCAVVLAGGRGTRFWPRSRMKTPKQLLNIVTTRTMLRETLSRLHPTFPDKHIWAVTNKEQADAVKRELPGVSENHVLVEPTGQNTAAAIGLAAIHLRAEFGDALMAVLPADHHIAQTGQFRRLAQQALKLAQEPGNLVMMGIPPTRPDMGFGYVERERPKGRVRRNEPYEVARFTEKPALDVARRYISSGRHYWNAGMFFWRVSTYLECLRDYLPATSRALELLAKKLGTTGYEKELARIYPGLENISVDYAVMEPATKTATGRRHVLVVPAEMGWSDLGSWAAVYELLVKKKGANVSVGPVATIDATGNFFWAPKKFVAAIGVKDLVVVETEDALLVCPRERSQDVGKIVKWLEGENLKQLL
jgi:mannose-1-phosphate guanylyltransferase